MQKVAFHAFLTIPTIKYYRNFFGLYQYFEISSETLEFLFFAAYGGCDNPVVPILMFSLVTMLIVNPTGCGTVLLADSVLN